MSILVIIILITLIYFNLMIFIYISHCWLPAKVMYPANSTKRFSGLTRSTSILLMNNVQIYIPMCNFHDAVFCFG